MAQQETSGTKTAAQQISIELFHTQFSICYSLTWMDCA